MAFRIPTFNLTCNIWRYNTDVSNPPDVVQVCNLAFGRREQLLGVSLPVVFTGGHTTSFISTNFYPSTLLLPPLTDIRPSWDGLSVASYTGDAVEVPAGSGVYYAVLGVGDIGKGFANEHRAAVVQLITQPLYTAGLNPQGTIAGPPWPLP